MKTLYLCGAGNPEGVRLALNINEKEARWNRIILLDDDPSKHGQAILGVEVAGPFEMLEQADPNTAEVSNMVAMTTARRWSARRKIEEFGLPFATLINPLVDMSGVTFGEDITVYSNATISAHASVDEASVIFTGAAVGHGCQLGQCCVVAPGAVINARVQVGDGVYIGTNASILPDLKIGAWATIGANSAVIEDVPAGATVMGVPAAILMVINERPDRKVFPGPKTDRPEREKDSGAPQSSTEEALANLWAQVLGIEKIGIHDNFFKLGGNSLSAVKVVFRIRQTFGVDLPLQTFFQLPTLASLAKKLEEEPVLEADDTEQDSQVENLGDVRRVLGV